MQYVLVSSAVAYEVSHLTPYLALVELIFDFVAASRPLSAPGAKVLSTMNLCMGTTGAAAVAAGAGASAKAWAISNAGKKAVTNFIILSLFIYRDSAMV